MNKKTLVVRHVKGVTFDTEGYSVRWHWTEKHDLFESFRPLLAWRAHRARKANSGNRFQVNGRLVLGAKKWPRMTACGSRQKL